MDKKMSVAVCMTAVLYIMLFAVVGSCFMAFKYEDEKVVVNDPNVIVAGNIVVTNSNGEPIDKLELSEVKLGLKPVTGELAHDTKIPVTVTDKNGSEGIYAKFKITTSVEANIKVKNLKVEGNEKLDLSKERKNIWLALKDENDSAKNLEDDVTVLGKVENASEGKEYTLFFWLSSVASEDFEMCTISFDVVIE